MALDNEIQGGLRQLVNLDGCLREEENPLRPGERLADEPRSILIAEDNAINQKVIERMVQHIDFPFAGKIEMQLCRQHEIVGHQNFILFEQCFGRNGYFIPTDKIIRVSFFANQHVCHAWR